MEVPKAKFNWHSGMFAIYKKNVNFAGFKKLVQLPEESISNKIIHSGDFSVNRTG